MIWTKILTTALIMSGALGVFSLNKMVDTDDVLKKIWWRKMTNICFYFFYSLLVITAIALVWLL